MVATNSEKHAEAKPPPDPKNAKANKNQTQPGDGPSPGDSPPPHDDGPAPTWDDVVRQGTVLRLMEHLNIGVQMVADLSKDPAFSADDRLQVVLASARMIQANANLGKAIGVLAQVEHRRRTVVQHIDPPKVWNDSISIQEVMLERDLTLKMLRYMKVIADETFDPAIAEAEAAAKVKAAQENPSEAKPTGTARADGASTPA